MSVSFFKVSFAVLVSTVAISFMDSSTYAAEYNPNNEVSANQLVNDSLPNSASVIALPDGGYLHGKMTDTITTSLASTTKKYDSDSDTKAFTMGELRAGNVPKKTPQIALRASSPSTSVKTLYAGADYRSEPFTGSGWRFAGTQFKPASGTGAYLLWVSQFEEGRAGTYAQARATANGSLSGTVIPTMVGKYLSGTTTYYTYNPNYSRYVVANR